VTAICPATASIASAAVSSICASPPHPASKARMSVRMNNEPHVFFIREPSIVCEFILLKLAL